MKLRHALSILALLTVSIASAQTADEIVNKHVQALGGKDVINQIKSEVIESNVSVMGTDLSNTTTLLTGKGFKTESSVYGQTVVQVITPTSGWMINPLQGMVDPQTLPADQVAGAQAILYPGGELFNYKEKGSKVDLVGRENVGSVQTYKLQHTDRSGRISFYYLDPVSYQVIKRELPKDPNTPGTGGVMTFSNFKKTDIGLVIPYTVVTNQGFEMTTTVNKIEFNKEIDPKIFEMAK